MKEPEFTNKEKRAAEKVVARLIDGGKTEAMLNEMAEKLAKLCEANKEENGFVLLVNTGDLGKVFCAVAGKPSTICAALDTALDEADVLEDCIGKVMTVRSMARLFKNITGKGVPGRPDPEDDED